MDDVATIAIPIPARRWHRTIRGIRTSWDWMYMAVAAWIGAVVLAVVFVLR